MTITFESDKDVIVFALEKIISYARENRYIFLAQSVWWISSIIGLQQGLVVHIDNLKLRSEARVFASELTPAVNPEGPVISPRQVSSDIVHPARLVRIQNSDESYITSDGDSVSTTETDIHNKAIEDCELFLEQSKQERKAIGRITRQASRVVKKKINQKKPIKTFGTQTEGIEGSELRRRKAAGECQRCAWPQDRKGDHKTLDCLRCKRLKKGTAPFPKNTRYHKG
jgi:hypothetical protein